VVDMMTGTLILRREVVVPGKIRELIADLQAAGFEDRGGKGSHRNFVHPKVAKPVAISGTAGDNATTYQERAVSKAIEESRS
jgi:predicted RNA binding protein YcfA (HicA-like mRNA interferase family)